MPTQDIKIYVTEDTIRGILLEVSRHPHLECIIQMPGLRRKNEFFFDLVSDSGINATYEYFMCEKDHVYVDHLSTMLSRYYKIPKNEITLSQVHKHPPTYKVFSSEDKKINQDLANQFNGVVTGLILVDPNFNLKFWYTDPNGVETPVEYVIDDAKVRRAMPKKDIKELQSLVEYQENPQIFNNPQKKKEPQKNLRDLIKYLFKKNVKQTNICKAICDVESDLLDEIREISYLTDVQCKKFPNGDLLFNLENEVGETLHFKTKTENSKLILIHKGIDYIYEKGLLKTLLENKGA